MENGPPQSTFSPPAAALTSDIVTQIHRNGCPLRSSRERCLSVPTLLPLSKLPLIIVLYRQFDELIGSYKSLAQTTLFTIRLELRCHVIYFLSQTIREGNFGLTEDEVEEEDLDPTIIELCKDLVSFEDLLSTTLQPTESTSCPLSTAPN